MRDDEFWNREIETMDRERLEKLQLEKLQAQLAWVFERSPFHRERMENAGVKPADITSLDRLRLIPIMDKEDYIREQKDHPPYGRMLCVNPREIVRYWTTSGSTGTPRLFGSTLEDYEDYLESAARVLWTSGVRPGMKVAVPFSHGHWIGLWGVFDATWQRLGAQIVALGGYDSKYRVTKMAEVKVDALAATPTYAAYLSEVALGQGLDVRSIGVKTIMTAGEPVAPASRTRLEDIWNARTFDFYGNTENLSYLGVDCRAQTGFHFWEDRTVVEIIDADGNAVKDGEQGQLVFTNLTNKAMPAVRLGIGDVTKIDRSACACGRTHLRVQYILGRQEDVLKIRGINVYPRVVEDVIRSLEGLGSEYRIVFRRQNALDALVLQVEPLDTAQPDELVATLAERVRTRCSITPTVELLLHGTLPTSEMKAKRVFDERGVSEFERV